MNPHSPPPTPRQEKKPKYSPPPSPSRVAAQVAAQVAAAQVAAAREQAAAKERKQAREAREARKARGGLVLPPAARGGLVLPPASSAQPSAQPAASSAPSAPLASLEINVHSDPEGDPHYPPDFIDALKKSQDIGLKFVDIHPNSDPNHQSVSFVIHIYLFMSDNTETVIQLKLADFLNFTMQQLLNRAAMDIRKDLTNAKIKLSANGAKEIIRKTMPGVFDSTLNKTLDELLGEYKTGWSLETPTPSPSAGEIMTPGILSSGDHFFKLSLSQLGENGGKISYRDSGPSVPEVNERYASYLAANRNTPPPLTRQLIIRALNGDDPVFHNTAGNYLDPATNPNYGHLYSPMFVYFNVPFLSKFNGVNNLVPDSLRLALHTDRIDNREFRCNATIEYGSARNSTKANFSNLYCNMTSKPEKGGIGKIPGAQQPVDQPKHTYSDTGGNDVNITDGSSTVNEFVHGISGNNEKNQFLLQFMNKQFVGTQKSQALAKIILKSYGDPNQLLFITAEILYYALMRLKEALQKAPTAGTQPAPNLHYFIKDTMNKYLLITCDSVLARLAVAFRFPVALQIGKTVAHITFEQTDDYVKAKCEFISKIETLKQNMDKYVSLLARCNGLMNTYIIYSDGNSAVNSNTAWGRTFDENKNLLCKAIREHYRAVERLGERFLSETQPQADGRPRQSDWKQEIDTLYAQLLPISMLFNKPLVTKSKKSTLHGITIDIYHLNYLQSLMIIASAAQESQALSNDLINFIFRTKICNTDILAYSHPDYLEGLTVVNQRNKADKIKSSYSSLSSPLSQSPPQSPPRPSPLLSSPSLDPKTGPKKVVPETKEPKLPGTEQQSTSVSRTPKEPINIPNECKQIVAAKLLETTKKPDNNNFIKLETESIERNRYALRPRQSRSQAAQGGGSHSHNIQKGGCQESHADPYINFDGLFGEKYNIVGFNSSLERDSAAAAAVKVHGTIQISLPIIFTADTRYDLLRLDIKDIPFIQFWTFALLSYFAQTQRDFIRNFFGYITGSPQVTPTEEEAIKLLVLHDIVSEYIVNLRIRDEEIKNRTLFTSGSLPIDQTIDGLIKKIQTDKGQDIQSFDAIQQEQEQPEAIDTYNIATQEFHELLGRAFHENEKDQRQIYYDYIKALIEGIIIYANEDQPNHKQLLYSLCQLMNGGLDTDADYSQLKKEPLEISATMAAVSISISLGREYSLSPGSNGSFSLSIASELSQQPSQQPSQQSFSIPDEEPKTPRSNTSSLQFGDTPQHLRRFLSTSPASSRASGTVGNGPITITPNISLETVLESIDTLLNIGYGIEKAKENLTIKDDKPTPSILYLLQLIKDRIQRIVLILDEQPDGIVTLINVILTDTCAYIIQTIPLILEGLPKPQAEAAPAEAEEAEEATAAPPAPAAMQEGSEGDVAEPTFEELHKKGLQEERRAVRQALEAAAAAAEARAAEARAAERARAAVPEQRTADAFELAEKSISRLIFPSEDTLFIGYLCKCCEVLCNFIIEQTLVNIDNQREYQFIRSKVDENTLPESITLSDPSSSDSDSDPGLASGGVALRGDLLSRFGGGHRPTSKKSTHRKPRRHTRNYQSHNKKPKRQRSSRSTKYNTIKHRKSYRKHNRTIKRRGNRK